MRTVICQMCQVQLRQVCDCTPVWFERSHGWHSSKGKMMCGTCMDFHEYNACPTWDRVRCEARDRLCMPHARSFKNQYGFTHAHALAPTVLALPPPVPPPPPPPPPPGLQQEAHKGQTRDGKKGGDKGGGKGNGDKGMPACFDHNKGEGCKRITCKYKHVCTGCGKADHIKPNCPDNK